MCRFSCSGSTGLIRRSLERSSLALLATLTAAPATASADLSGEWKHVRTKMSFKVTAWGEECGPRPQNENRKQRGKVTVTESGGKVVLKKRRWKFGTHKCLSENPEMKFKGFDSGSRTTKCATAPGDSKGEKGSYTLKTPDENTIRYEGKTVYDWSLKGVSCKATMKEVQIFERKVVAPPPPVVEAPPPPEPEVVAEPVIEPEVVKEGVIEEVVDKVTGRVTRRRKKRGGGYVILDLEGTAGRGGAGGLGGLADERHQSGTASARRGTGLALAIALGTVAISLFAGAFLLMSRRRRRGPRPGGRGGGGSGGGGGGGTGTVDGGLGTASSGQGPRPPPLASHRHPGGGGPLAALPSAGLGGGPGVPPPPPVAQSGAGGRMLCPKCQRDYDPAERFCPYDAVKLQRASAAAPSAEFVLAPRLICRTCLREFAVEQATGASLCPDDGDRLLPLVGAEARHLPDDAAAEDGLDASAALDATLSPAIGGPETICPRCSARYSGGVVYCGKDGSELVLLN